MCALLLTAVSCGKPPPTAGLQPAWNEAPAAPKPIPEAERPYGPLSITARVAETPWAERKRAMRRNDERLVDLAAMREDIAALSAVIDLFFAPRTPDRKEALTFEQQHFGLLLKLAPYAVGSTHHALLSIGERVGFCARPPDEMWHCDPYFTPRPAADPASAPYEVSVAPSGIATVTIRDLSNAYDPAWARLSTDLTQVARASGIVIDMRAAWGHDPRPLLPWLEGLTGRTPLAPLHEIRRPSALTRYVDAYQAKYQAESRNPALWQTLIGTAATTSATTPPPIAVVVGRHCESACELVARVLETYSGASVVGGVGKSGRLHHDEPAMLTLPHSRIDVYFHATEYLLSPEIEAKTGPTHAWRSRGADLVDFDGTAYATREVEMRIKNPAGWPARCDGYREYRQKEALPDPFRKKIQGEFYLDDRRCSEGSRSISVTTDLPASAVRRFVETCPPPTPTLGSYVRGQFNMSFSAKDPFAVVSRLAQSDVVQSIWIQCVRTPEPDGR